MNQKLKYYGSFLTLLVAYAAIFLRLPPDPAAMERYGLSLLQAKLLALTIVVPLLLIWFCAFFGFYRLKRYSQRIRKSQEGKGIHWISRGLGWLAYGLPVLSIASTLMNYYARQNPDFRAEAVIAQNYLNLALYIISFMFISRGAYILINYVKKKPLYGEQHAWVILHIVLAVTYTYFVLKRPLFAASSGESIYYLPDWLVLMTLVIPYLYLWYMGLKSAYRIFFYAKLVKGSLYRRSVSFLAFGVSLIILSTIALQLISTLSAQLDRLSLAPLLTLIYILLILIASGYLFVALGARRLKRLEEV